MKLSQKVRLGQNQGQELCDEIANMLLNAIEAQDIDNKVKAAVDVLLTKQNVDADPSASSDKLPWSIRVKLEQ